MDKANISQCEFLNSYLYANQGQHPERFKINDLRFQDVVPFATLEQYNNKAIEK